MSRIGELLIKHGIVTQEQLAKALRLQETSDKRLGEILIELGYLSTDDLHWMLSEQANIPFVEIEPEMLDAPLLRKFDRDVLYEHGVLPLHESETRIYVAVGDPTSTASIERIEEAANKKAIASGAPPEKIRQLLDGFYKKSLVEEESTLIKIRTSDATIIYIDESGQRTKRKLPLEIIFKTIDEEGGTDNV
jgi:type IV pilus assembly protein PilB